MIEEGDRITVGVSGGKDSLILLYVLRYLQKSLPVNFKLMAVTIALGWGTNFEPVARFCENIGVPYEQVDTRIGPIIFETRKEKNPCALCSRMRRGALDDRTKERGFNKVALGHNFDDALETLFLSMFYEGRTRTFLPRNYLDRKDLTLIRPLVYVPEKNLTILAGEKNLPVIKNACPAAGKTKRQVVKEIVDYIEERVPKARYRLWLALQRIEKDHLWPTREELEEELEEIDF
ncbi:MAG: tRNA 2-thiocytidine(32) synthetase TtcA [Firmicutes bacterium HGW-Firmicutes-13]|nr:MAG: tRNA 2-thiocytidine(32) synthetase TtcA [Firmicutes bacterium HGW-Firmicutes-13]